jgi:lipopolysaccharide transport system permease protein
MSVAQKKWDWEIGAATSDFNWKAKELWSYRHLLKSLVQRTFLLNYQQTILGPLWTLLQPILTLVIYMMVFKKMVGLSTGNLPPVLFYFSGIVLWNFFNECFTGSVSTFKDNMNIFSKVYFPRIIMPLSVASASFMRLVIQMCLLLVLMLYYTFFSSYNVPFSWTLLGAPVAVFLVGILALGLGLACSVLTAKYRDLLNVVNIVIRLLMFVTPVIYPLGSVNKGVNWIIMLNPLTPMFEFFRWCLLGEGTVLPLQFACSFVFAIFIFVTAVHVFNKQGNKLMDIV